MTRKMRMGLLVVIGLAVALVGGAWLGRWALAEGIVPQGTLLGTTFTYQGRLTDSATGDPVAGPCDLRFSLYESATGNDPVGTAQVVPGVTPDNGFFSAELDFGGGAFQGYARYLKVEVDCGAGYANLDPRVALNAAPYALYARSIPLDGSGASTSAARADHDHDGDYQAKLKGTCPVGSTIRAVDADGSVVCQADAPLNRPVAPAGNVSTTLDSGAFTGQDTSVTIGVDGLGLISYYDAGKGDLKVAHCDNQACTSATISTLDSSGDVGLFTSIAIGTDGLGLISYGGSGSLKVAHCENVACTSAAIVTIDPSAWVREYDTSLAIGVDGLGVISYYDFYSGLRVAHCDDVACSTASNVLVDSAAAEYHSLTIAGNGLPMISYHDPHPSSKALKLVSCGNLDCSVGNYYAWVDWDWTLGRTIGEHNSITTGSDGLALISYSDDGVLKVAHCRDLGCADVISATLDIPVSGYHTSVTVGADGLGVISYRDAARGQLKVAHCASLDCDRATLQTVDANGIPGQHTSITIGADGLPLISYYDVNNNNLKVVHCASPFCVPYFRRR